MPTPNGGTEPNQVIADVAAANNAPAAIISAPVPPRVMSATELIQENVPASPQANQSQPIPEAQRNADREKHAQKFDFQLNMNLKKVQQSVDKLTADGKDLDEAWDEAIQGIPQHLQGHITKLYNGEQVDGHNGPVDPNKVADNAVSKMFALRDAQDSLIKAFADNKLNVATAEAMSARQVINADYQRLLKTNTPQEAARFALFNAGIANKQAVDAAFNSGQQFANKGAPVPGYPGQPSAGSLQQGNELTEEQIRNTPLDKIMEHDQQIVKSFNNSMPAQMAMPAQGNPNVM